MCSNRFAFVVTLPRNMQFAIFLYFFIFLPGFEMWHWDLQKYNWTSWILCLQTSCWVFSMGHVRQTPWLGTIVVSLRSVHDQDAEGINGQGNGGRCIPLLSRTGNLREHRITPLSWCPGRKRFLCILKVTETTLSQKSSHLYTLCNFVKA